MLYSNKCGRYFWEFRGFGSTVNRFHLVFYDHKISTEKPCSSKFEFKFTKPSQCADFGDATYSDIDKAMKLGAGDWIYSFSHYKNTDVPRNASRPLPACWFCWLGHLPSDPQGLGGEVPRRKNLHSPEDPHSKGIRGKIGAQDRGRILEVGWRQNHRMKRRSKMTWLFPLRTPRRSVQLGCSLWPSESCLAFVC